ncbi:ribosome maturation factor RimM [Sulfuriflexus mobilis]|uniref:ribosome maturation factor RimM n=1 Tax=Sulfuriflexus mobilis TaxID=1811807 RepID=UPI000F824973|nr:ribosome maturation factor RimM [Sulfuriflexus mobilis]
MSEPDSKVAQNMIVVGKISGLYGVRGWCKVFSHTEPRDNILKYSPWYLRKDNAWQAVEVVEGRQQGKGIIVHLQGCDDRDAAAALMGTEVAIKPEQRAGLAADEYYWSDLIGCQVETLDGVELGHIESMMETGANDVIVVAGERERLIPFVQGDVVVEVDTAARRVRVDWDPDF